MPYSDWSFSRQMAFTESAVGAIFVLLLAYSVAGIVLGLILRNAALTAWSACPILSMVVLSLTYRRAARKAW